MVTLPQMKRQPQRHARGDERNQHRERHQQRIPLRLRINQQGRHTKIVHHHHARAQDQRAAQQPLAGEMQAANRLAEGEY